MKSSNKKTIIFFFVFIIFLMILGINIEYINKNKQVTPIVKIILKDTSLDEINNNRKEIKYKNNSINIIDGNKEINMKNITIKGRGNTTWQWPKKPYQIQFDKEINLFNLGKSDKFLLLANYIDATLLRNHIASFIADKLDMPYVLKGKNVDLYVNNEYQGTYYLVNKLEISEGSINLDNKNAILLELDNVYYYQDDYMISNKYKDHIVIKDMNNKYLKHEVTTGFMNKYNRLEEAVEQHNWEEIIGLIDIDSLAKHHIVYELTRNGDAYRTSFYMYMNGVEDLIHFGPVWDFDMAFDNKTSDKTLNSKNLEPSNSVKDETYNKYSNLFYSLTNFDEFKIILKQTWNKYMNNNLEEIKNEINNNYKLLNKSATKNIKKWKYAKTYQEYKDDLIDKVESIYNNYNLIINSY